MPDSIEYVERRELLVTDMTPDGDPVVIEYCRCGHGWCPIHGTDHLPVETEYLADEIRVMNLRPSGGQRVIRKKIRSE